MSDSIAVGSGGHRVTQRDDCRFEDVILLDAAEAGRRGARDCAKSKPRIIDIEITKNACEAVLQAGRRKFGSGRERRAQKNDAEVGVDADCRERRIDGGVDAFADTGAGFGDRCRCGVRAGPEFGCAHSVAGCKDVHVARLWGVEFLEAGGFERGGDLLGWRRHPVAPCCARSPRAVTSPVATTAAMLSVVTFCSPDHAGMLLTSSTVGWPSVSCRMSTPANAIATAADMRV